MLDFLGVDKGVFVHEKWCGNHRKLEVSDICIIDFHINHKQNDYD